MAGDIKIIDGDTVDVDIDLGFGRLRLKKAVVMEVITELNLLIILLTQRTIFV